LEAGDIKTGEDENCTRCEGILTFDSEKNCSCPLETIPNPNYDN